MAVPRTHVPNPAAFQSDPTEQIFAKGVADGPDAGLNYMFMRAARERRGGDTEQYMQGLTEANRIAQAMQSQEEGNKRMMEVLKQSVELAKGAVGNPSNMPALNMVYGANGGENDEFGMLKRALMASEAAANNAKAVSSTAEGRPEFSAETAVTPSGVSQEILRVKQKGGDSALLQEILRKRALQALEQRGIKGSGTGGTGLPNANARDVSQTQEYKRSNGWGG